MANIRRPRHGSLQFWPRHKSQRPQAKIKSWLKTKNSNLLGFAGYKAGMTHISIKDNRTNSLTKGETVVWPVTVLECPPLKLYSLRFYNISPYGEKVANEAIVTNLDKEVARKVRLTTKKDFEVKVAELSKKAADFHELRVVMYTQPKKTGIGKKKPELFEMGIGGNTIQEKINYALTLVNKEIRVSDIFKTGAKLDIHAVSKGKGFQGVIKRHHVHLMNHKTEKKRRTNIYGPGNPAKIRWGMIMPGRLGFNLRTEYNKDLVLLGDKPEKINPDGGFLHYGLVKNDYVLIKGSVPGHVKRLITFTEPIRGTKSIGQSFEVQYISQRSKQ
jgi:large subunit ribosomal protein L3